MIPRLKKRPASSILGLALDGKALQGVVLRRSNGALEIQHHFFATLALDPLTNDAELVGREIRNHLEKAGIRERQCAVSLPLNWALILHTKVPKLPEADINSFLQIEAERGFPYGPDALLMAHSRYRSPSGEEYATQVAVPRDHVGRLEKALKAARLKPITFSLGITALQPPSRENSNGVLALVFGDSTVGLQVSLGGGVATLRTLEETFETDGGEKHLSPEAIARELRITLGQLPGEVRQAVGRLRVFGTDNLAAALLEGIQSAAQSMGMQVELVRSYSPNEFGRQLAADAPVSAALSLAAGSLAGRHPALDFLPPKVRPWDPIITRYSSKKLVPLGAAAGAIALLVASLFLIQQWQLSRWRGQWSAIDRKVTELDGLQVQIKQFRPWFDESFRSLSILRRLTEAFPEDGVVAAKTVEIRDQTDVTCSGTARDSQALLKTLDQLRGAKEIFDVKVDQIRGKSPLQFTFNFHWGGAREP